MTATSLKDSCMADQPAVGRQQQEEFAIMLSAKDVAVTAPLQATPDEHKGSRMR